MDGVEGEEVLIVEMESRMELNSVIGEENISSQKMVSFSSMNLQILILLMLDTPVLHSVHSKRMISFLLVSILKMVLSQL